MDNLIDFIKHQLQYLKQILKNCLISPIEITKEKIIIFIGAIQEKIKYLLNNNTSLQQSQEFIIGFYQLQIKQLLIKQEQLLINLKIEKQTIKQLEKQNKLMKKQQVLSPNWLESKLMIQSQTKQLQHCKQIIQNNQSLLNQQQQTINQLNRQLNNQKKSSKKFEEKIYETDSMLNQNNRVVKNIVKKYDQEIKKIEKTIKQIQYQNIQLLEKQSKLQEMIILKNQQIKLMAKKICEFSKILMEKEQKEKLLNLMIEKNQKQRGQIDQQLLFDKEKYQKSNELWQFHFKTKIEELKKKQLQINQLKLEIVQLKSQNSSLKAHLSRLQAEFENQSIQIKKIKDKQNNIFEQLNKNNKQFQEKYKSKLSNQKIYYQEALGQTHKRIRILEKELQQTKQQKLDQINKFKTQKLQIKLDIQIQISKLVQIHQKQEKIIKVQSQEICQLQSVKLSLEKKIYVLQHNLSITTSAFQQLSKKQQSWQNQKINILECKNILETEIEKIRRQYENTRLEVDKLKKKEKHQEQNYIKKIIELEKTIQKIKLQEYQQQYNKQQQKASIKYFQEQIHHKNLEIKQLTIKINLLNNNIREIEKKSKQDKYKYQQKIKQLEDILKEKIDIEKNFNRNIIQSQ